MLTAITVIMVVCVTAGIIFGSKGGFRIVKKIIIGFTEIIEAIVDWLIAGTKRILHID